MIMKIIKDFLAIMCFLGVLMNMGYSKEAAPYSVCMKETDIAEAVYTSEEGELLTVVFDNGARIVTLHLPDGRTVTLPQAISASGARYSNDRETFWEHHGEGAYWIGEELIFSGKAEWYAD